MFFTSSPFSQFPIFITKSFTFHVKLDAMGIDYEDCPPFVPSNPNYEKERAERRKLKAASNDESREHQDEDLGIFKDFPA